LFPVPSSQTLILSYRAESAAAAIKRNVGLKRWTSPGHWQKGRAATPSKFDHYL